MENGSFPVEAYAVLKGGGVAGMAHVGALQELERHFKFVGYAGTSAGSLVALLAAAGLNAQEMAEVVEKLNFPSLLGTNACMIWLIERWKRLLGLSFLSLVLCIILHAFRLNWAALICGLLLAGILVFTCFLLWRLNSRHGIVAPKELEKFLIEQVRTKIPDFDEFTTFRDFEKKSGKLLKIFATDLSEERLWHCNRDSDDGKMPVLPAVLSSAAFPFFFWSGRLNQRTTTDGGLTCNLPVIAFSDECNKRRLPIIALDLTWKETIKGRLSIIEFVKRIVSTPVKAHDEILEEYLPRAMRLKIVVPEGIDVMDLRLSSAEKDLLKKAGLEAAAKFMKLEALDAYALESQKRVSSPIEFARRLYLPQQLVVPSYGSAAKRFNGSSGWRTRALPSSFRSPIRCARMCITTASRILIKILIFLFRMAPESLGWLGTGKTWPRKIWW